MNIGVIGIGGVGGYFGGKLAHHVNKDHKVYFIARSAHLEAVKNKGLELETVDEHFIVHPYEVTDQIEALPVLDLCLICVKAYDLENVVKKLNAVMNEQTIVIPLLNGVDIVERIRTYTNKGIVLPACVYVGTHIEKPGKVKQKGGSCIIHCGHIEGISELKALFNEADIHVIWYENPYGPIWEKYIFIAAYGMVTAATGKVLGAVMEDAQLARDVIGIMNEIAAVARLKNIELPKNIVQSSFDKGANFPYEAKTSFQRDYEHTDKQDEGMLFGETIIRMSEENGLYAPVTKRYMYALQA